MGEDFDVANAEIASAVRQEVERRLTAIEHEEGVQYLFAIESGSRAWGFPSPDSDYDVRFVYLRPLQDYLALSPVRDVIERPIVDEIDLNGWDIRKALGLLLRHNCVLSEWVESPIRYREDHPFVGELAELADRHFNPLGFARHYANLGKTSAKRWLGRDEAVPIKKYFYALRPALAVRCLRLDPANRPPMKLQSLVERCDLPASIIAEIDEMVCIKAETREAGDVAARPDIDRLIAAELRSVNGIPERDEAEVFARDADALFVSLVSGAGG